MFAVPVMQCWLLSGGALGSLVLILLRCGCKGGVVSSFEIWGWGLGVGSSLPLLSLAVAHRRFPVWCVKYAFWGRGCPGE